MRKASIITMLLVVAVLAGCANQRQAVYNAANSYALAANTLVMYREAGKIDDAEWATVKEIDNQAFSALTIWNDCVRQGLPTIEAAAKFNDALNKMLEARILAESKGGK